MKKFLSILLAVMMVLSTVSFAAPSIAGVADTAVETPVAESPVAEEAEEAADLAADTADVSTYGTLIFNLDFEDNTYPADGSISSAGPVNSYTSAENEITLPEEFGSAYFRIGMPNSWSGEYNTSLNGTNVLPVLSNAYPYFTVRAYESSSSWTSDAVVLPTGYYTVVGDFAKDADNTGSGGGIVRSRIGNAGGVTSGNDQSLTTTMTTYTHQFIVEESSSTAGQYQFRDSASGAAVCGPYAAISTIGTYFGTSTANNDIYYVDNYKMYWKPLTAEVTLVSDADYLTLPEEAFEVSTNGVLVSELVADVETAGYQYSVTGVKIGGVEYALTDTVYVTKDTEVEVLSEEDTEYTAKWIDDKHGYLLFDIDFEDSRAATALTATTVNNDYTVKDFATVNPYIAGSENWKLSNSGMDIIGIENGALKIQWDGSGQWPQVLIGNPANVIGSAIMGQNGTYYVHEEIKALGSLDTELQHINLTANGIIDGEHQKTTGILKMGTDYYAQDIKADEWFIIDGGKSTWDNDKDGLDNDDITKITTVFNHSAVRESAGGYYLMDNIKLWWKPDTADVTINANGLIGVTGGTAEDITTTSGLTAQEILEAAGVDISGVNSLQYTIKGISTTADGSGTVYGLNDTVDLALDSTFYIIWEKVDMSDWTDENGVLVWEINFENLTTGNAYVTGTLISNMGKINPAFTSNNSKTAMQMNSSLTATIKEDTAHGKYLEYTNAGDYREFYIRTMDNNLGFSSEKGSYVLTMDVLNPSTNSSSAADPFTIRMTIAQDGVEDVPTMYPSTKGGWDEYKAVYDSTRIGSTNNGMQIADITEVGRIKLHTRGETTDVFGIDNIRLYYLPETTTLTIKNTTNDLVPASQEIEVSSTVKLSDLKQYVKAGLEKYELAGWSYKDGGDLIETDVITLAVPTTIYPVWAEYNYVYSYEFNEEYSNCQALKDNTSFAWNSYGSNTDSNLWGVNVQGTIYNNIKWTGGYNTFTMKAPDSHTGIDGTRWIYGTQNKGDGMLQDKNITAGTVKAIQTRVRYRNVPDFSSCSDDGVSADKTSHTVSNVTVGTVDGTFDMTDTVLLEFNCLFVGNYWSGALQVEGDIVEGEWIEATIDVTNNSAFNNYKLYGIYMDPTPFMWDGMIMEVDYVRLLSTTPGEIIKPEPEYAPTSSTETSYRTEAPNGIRFKATMTGEINAVADSYGWVVGRAAKGATEETLVIGAANTVTAYGRENNVDIKNFFDEDDDLKTFTAVVYNIPVGNEDDVLCIKPFVIVDGTVYYGDMISKSPRQVATAHGIDVSVLMTTK